MGKKQKVGPALPVAHAVATGPDGTQLAVADDVPVAELLALPEQERLHQKDEISGRNFTVEYLNGVSGRTARERGRVTLTLADLPQEMATLPVESKRGGYRWVQKRSLKRGASVVAKGAANIDWFQPMFKRRSTVEGPEGPEKKDVWFTKLGTYTDAGVAAVAAELAAARYDAGEPSESIYRVEADIVQAARELAAKLSSVPELPAVPVPLPAPELPALPALPAPS